MVSSTIRLDNLIILNDYDRPCMYLIACKEPLQYACLSMRQKFPDIKLDASRITPLEKFGFVQEGDTFKKVKPSTATYSDGRIREWQGREEFNIEDLLTKEKV